MRTLVAVRAALLTLLAAAACGGTAPSPDARTAQAPGQAATPDSASRGRAADAAAVRAPDPDSAPPVQLQMRNVDFTIDSGIVLRISRLRGVLIPTKRGVPPALDDRHSFTLRISAAQIAMDMASLGALLNRHVFGYHGAPIGRLRVATDGDELVQTGVIHKGVDIPFRIRATMTLTPAGEIRLHPTAVRALGMNLKSVLKFFGAHLEGMMKLQAGHGARIEGDDFILDAAGMLPAPSIHGQLTAIKLGPDRIEQTFGRANAEGAGDLRRPDMAAPNFAYFQGGRLRFGKLTMHDTDLDIVDADPRDPFDLSLERYDDQLVAGYSRNTHAHGLIVHMPDLHSLPARGAAGPPPR